MAFMYSDGEYMPSVSVLSMHSLAEHSEPISETEEIESVRRLLKEGNRAFKRKKYDKAISCYSDALEIESDNTQILTCRAGAYLETRQYELSKKDAENIIKINPNIPQAYYLQAVCFDHLDQPARAIKSFLNALQLDQHHEQQLADNIVVVAANLCTLPQDIIAKLEEMSITEQLLAVGRQLQKSEHYSISNDILLVANNRSSDVKDKLISLYYIGKGYEGMQNTLQSMEYLQKCLVLSLQEINREFEAACYHTLGQIYFDKGYIQEFTVNFEKLLAVVGDLEDLNDKVLHVNLHETNNIMNMHEQLCKAYSGMGAYDRALVHAKELLDDALCESDTSRLQRVHLLVANLHFERLEYTLALNHYEAYMATCKKLHDRAGMAAAYGYIGVVYKTLCNYKLAESYLEQQCRISEKLKDNESQAMAFFHLGEIADKTGKFDAALKHFQNYLRISRRLDEFETEVKAFLRLGELQKSYDNYQHARYYYEQALNLAERIGNKSLMNACKCKVASILVTSTELKNFEKARVLIETCIFDYIALLKKYNTDSIAFPEQLQCTMLEAFDLLQIVLQKLSRPDDALMFAEIKKSLIFNAHESNAHFYRNDKNMTYSLPTIKQVNKILDKQESAVIFYAVTDDFILLWVLKPGEGCVRTERIELSNATAQNKLKNALESLHVHHNKQNSTYETEYRSLPLEDSETLSLQNKFLRQSTTKMAQIEDRHDGMREEMTELQDTSENEKPTRILYNLLLHPVLSELKECKELTVIPDKELFHVPFDSLEDSNGVCFGESYQLTMIPSLNVLNHLNNILTNPLGEQSRLESSPKDAGSSPIYLDDRFRVVVPPKDYPFAPIHDTIKVAPKMSDQKCDNPKLVSFGRNYYDVVKVEKDEVRQFEKRKLQQNIEKGSTLISSTWCGKEVPSVKSETINEYHQTSGGNLSVVIGSPHLPAKAKIHGKDWTPPSEYKAAHKECHRVAEYLDTEAIVAKYASKQTVMKEIPNATLIHLALPGCWKKGALACASDKTSLPNSDGVYPEEAYLLGRDDIAALHLRAQLVVISGCFGHRHRKVDLMLPSAFLAAGAKCVLVLLWATPDIVQEKFWYHFYMALQKGSYLSKAVEKAKMSIRKDARFQDLVFWAPFVLIGIDQYIDISIIKRDMLDQQLNRVEGQILCSMPSDALNLKTSGVSKTQLVELKSHLAQLLLHHQQHPDAVATVQGLLKECQQIFAQQSPASSVRLLPQCAVDAPAAIPLLHLVGFHFQARGVSNTEPYVVWPQWDPYGLLGPALQATEAIIDICVSEDCAYSLARVLECEIILLSSLLDLLCLTRHAPELQLKKSDHLVNTLWKNHTIRTFLVSVGLQEVGKLVMFHNSLKNKTLLAACMKCICAILGKKGSALLNKLDPKYIGMPPPEPVPPLKKNRLPSLNPIVIPGNKMTFSTPWWSQKATPNELKTKIELANSLAEVHTGFSRQVRGVQKMHNECIQPQAKESLATLHNGPKEKPLIVKVIPGATPSCDRVPVEMEEKLSLLAVQQRRNYAHFVFNSRLEDVKIRHREAVKSVFLPHVQNR
ncbi:uncharacterized protein LOC117108052 [Anneissia japonica]|uniref:uncharacterized protein LOC117108052 n=1 Tax=Anneissia japonica TaxID=1529436 RepID=UPI001425B709|nr:uncharacterized protein LOC117108052 [Anneissia japonica]XP_033105803.1 uncharacterized protein LOC117108052 [Anneissia japonica]